MSNIEQLELQVSKLTPQELAHFRAWYAAFDAATWDRQLARDVAAGKLDALAERALQAPAAGKTKAL